MDEAIAAVVNGSSIRTAATKFNVPSSSLHDRVSLKKFGKKRRKGDISEDMEHEVSMVVPEKKRWDSDEMQDMEACDQKESVESLESHVGGRDIAIVPSTNNEPVLDMNSHAAINGRVLHAFRY